MRFRKKPSFLTLLNNFKLAFVRALVRLSQSLEAKRVLTQKIMYHLQPIPKKQKTLEILIAKKISELEDKGIISIKNEMIYPGKQADVVPDIIETSLAKTMKEIGFDEHTDFYLTRLQKSDGIFSWRRTLLMKIKIMIQNIFFFWRSAKIRHYWTVKKLIEQFFEWETILSISETDPKVKVFLTDKFEIANQISSSTILERTSFGKAKIEPLGDQPVFIISDLHLATGNKFDRFNKAAKLVRLLKVVEKLKAILIVNGDFFDFWQATPHNVFIKYKEILWELLRIKRVILIVGNHDNWLENYNNQRFLMPNISVLSSFYDPGNHLYIEHGHLGDPINKSLFGEINTRLFMFLEKITRIHLLEKTENVLRKLTPQKIWYEHQIRSYINRMAEIYYDELQLEPQQGKLVPLRIIFGHIHYKGYLNTIAAIQKELIAKLPEVEFISCGHWTVPDPVFLYMESGEIYTVKLQGGIEDFLQNIQKNNTND